MRQLTSALKGDQEPIAQGKIIGFFAEMPV